MAPEAASRETVRMERPDGIVDFTPHPGLYPFESLWFDSSVGSLHYVDHYTGTGEGRPIVLLHGNPDWSFLYRKIIPRLSDKFRCIAPDYPGFGLSVHPDDYGFTPGEHAAAIAELIAGLDLTDMIVMGQDWGGPIGMDIASRHADRVGGIVMGNTWYWPTDSRRMRTFSRVMSSPPMQSLILRRNFFVDPAMKRSLQVPVTDLEFAHYTDVVPTPESRRGIAVFPKEIIAAAPWLAELEKRVADELTETPMLLFFGRKDIALGGSPFSDRWTHDFPDATVIELPEAGHYIQEDAPDEIADAILAEFG
jgi:haloalkane dehalogenase